MKKKEILIIFVLAVLVTILCHFVPFCREIFTVCEPRAFGGCREHVEIALPLWFLVLAAGWWIIKWIKRKYEKRVKDSISVRKSADWTKDTSREYLRKVRYNPLEELWVKKVKKK